jgi:hypothetical protein
MDIVMRDYKGDGATWGPDWSNDYLGNLGYKYIQEIGARYVDDGTLEELRDAAEADNAESAREGYEGVTTAEIYDIGSRESTDAELLWAYRQADTYDMEAGESSICLEMIRRMGLEDEYKAADDAEPVLDMAEDMLAALVEG